MDNIEYTEAEYLDNGTDSPRNTPMSLVDFGAIIPNTKIDYTPIEISEVNNDLSTRSTELINKLVDVYYDKNNTSDEVKAYIERIKQSESNSYKQLLFQTRATEHMIQSLLERLNSTGSTDNSLYKLLMEIIREANVLTMQVSNYVRNLPQTFKTMKYELETSIDMVHIDKSDEMIAEEANLDPDDFIKRPQRGMRELLKIAEEMKDLNHEENKDALEDDSNIPIADTNKLVADNKEEDDLLRMMQEDNE